MTPKEFTSFPARSTILTESECLAILMNLNSEETWPMPSDVLSSDTKARGQKRALAEDYDYWESPPYYGNRPQFGRGRGGGLLRDY